MNTPSVGIFLGIPAPNHDWQLLCDKTSIERGEVYGDCITHATGHYDFWELLVRSGASALTARGLPRELAWHEYEDFPRGRVVYWPQDQRFVIYADRWLCVDDFIRKITFDFGISDNIYTVQHDSHYISKRVNF